MSSDSNSTPRRTPAEILPSLVEHGKAIQRARASLRQAKEAIGQSRFQLARAFMPLGSFTRESGTEAVVQMRLSGIGIRSATEHLRPTEEAREEKTEVPKADGEDKKEESKADREAGV